MKNIYNIKQFLEYFVLNNEDDKRKFDTNNVVSVLV